MKNQVTVTNNDENLINLEVTAYKNEVNLEFTESNEAALSVHDTNIKAHSNIIAPITGDIDNINSSLTAISNSLATKVNTTDVNSALTVKANTVDVETLLATKADISTTYTKTETNAALASKLDAADTTVTKQGNNFNIANKLVQLNASGQLPAIDGSLLTGLAGGLLSINALGTITANFSLVVNKVTTANIGASIALSLPTTGIISGVENKCVFDFTLTSAYALSFPSGVKWASGIAPSSFSTISGVRNIIEFVTRDGGTTWEAKYETRGGVLVTFSQPTLSVNGTLGGTSFAVSASSDVSGQLSYMACDGSLTTGWSTAAAAPAYFIIYNPIPIEVISFDITNYPTSDSHGVYAPTSGVVYGSNDNVTYTTISTFTNSVVTIATKWNLAIPSANQNFYKYYKIYVSMGSCGSGYGISIGEIKINGYYVAIS